MEDEKKVTEAAEEEKVPEEEMSAEGQTEEETGAAADEAPEAEESAAAAEEKKEDKPKLFGRNSRAEKAEKALKEKEAQVADMTDRLQRQMAEFDNFRKRSEKEKAAQFDMGVRNVLEKLLPLVDSFERGLGSLSDEQKESDPFTQGMDKVYKQMQKMLEDLEVKPIEALNKPFDANLHYAVMHEENEEVGENIITQELLKGYTYKDAVIRYSMVKVAN